MNLIYICVFYQESYIQLLKLLITSIHKNSNKTDILIMTSPAFQPIIEKEISCFDLSIKYYIFNVRTLFETGCARYNIFNYEKIYMYNKILYLDTDVLVNSDLNILFNQDISPDKLYALEEGTIGHEYWGSQFFDSKINRNISAFSSGVLYFMNSITIKNLFNRTKSHITKYSKGHPVPECLDQPFIVYNAISQNKYDNQMMKLYVKNNPSIHSSAQIIYHFPGGVGHFTSKYDKMTEFWEKMNKNI